jgi:crotonobetaine/carnitine-CoA ligase
VNRPEFIGSSRLCFGAILVRSTPLHVTGARLLVKRPALAPEHVSRPCLEAIWIIGQPAGVRPGAARPLPALGEAVRTPTRPSITGDPLRLEPPGHLRRVLPVHSLLMGSIRVISGGLRDDILCTTLPLFHTNALNTLFQALLTGATAISSQFSASAFWTTLSSGPR